MFFRVKWSTIKSGDMEKMHFFPLKSTQQCMDWIHSYSTTVETPMGLSRGFLLCAKGSHHHMNLELREQLIYCIGKLLYIPFLRDMLLLFNVFNIYRINNN